MFHTRHWFSVTGESKGTLYRSYESGILTILHFKPQPHKMVKHTQINLRILATNYLSVFDHFVVLALKGLKLLDICRVSKKGNIFI